MFALRSLPLIFRDYSLRLRQLVAGNCAITAGFLLHRKIVRLFTIGALKRQVARPDIPPIRRPRVRVRARGT